MEGFASSGGMLPEQIWDENDRPSAGMYLGQPTEAAMPLVWAHAEYIKLLRSAADGQPFDLVPIVAQRYLTGSGRKDLEVWKPNRQVRQTPMGGILRVQAPQPFSLHWSMDGWKTSSDSDSQATGLGLSYVDLPISGPQREAVQFTFFWTREHRWEGRDFEVRISSAKAAVNNVVPFTRPALAG